MLEQNSLKRWIPGIAQAVYKISCHSMVWKTKKNLKILLLPFDLNDDENHNIMDNMDLDFS